jgi:putative aldouronate transport system substrate-binding protein
MTSSFLGTIPVDTKQTAIADMYVASAYTPVINKGDKVNFSTAAGSGRVAMGFAISTAAAEDLVPVIMSYFDYFYTKEGSILANYGLEGDSLEYDADGNPHYTKIINTTAVDGVNFFHVYDKALLSFPFMAFDKERILGRAQEILDLQSKWVVTGTDLAVLPRLSLSSDESAKASSITNDANTYANEMSVKFITGDESLDNYDTMLETLKTMGIEEAIAINQTALDRYNAR